MNKEKMVNYLEEFNKEQVFAFIGLNIYGESDVYFAFYNTDNSLYDKTFKEVEIYRYNSDQYGNADNTLEVYDKEYNFYNIVLNEENALKMIKGEKLIENQLIEDISHKYELDKICEISAIYNGYEKFTTTWTYDNNGHWEGDSFHIYIENVKAIIIMLQNMSCGIDSFICPIPVIRTVANGKLETFYFDKVEEILNKNFSK